MNRRAFLLIAVLFSATAAASCESLGQSPETKKLVDELSALERGYEGARVAGRSEAELVLIRETIDKKRAEVDAARKKDADALMAKGLGIGEAVAKVLSPLLLLLIPGGGWLASMLVGAAGGIMGEARKAKEGPTNA